MKEVNVGTSLSNCTTEDYRLTDFNRVLLQLIGWRSSTKWISLDIY